MIKNKSVKIVIGILSLIIIVFLLLWVRDINDTKNLRILLKDSDSITISTTPKMKNITITDKQEINKFVNTLRLNNHEIIPGGYNCGVSFKKGNTSYFIGINSISGYFTIKDANLNGQFFNLNSDMRNFLKKYVDLDSLGPAE